jgi:hypothetical protein
MITSRSDPGGVIADPSTTSSHPPLSFRSTVTVAVDDDDDDAADASSASRQERVP